MSLAEKRFEQIATIENFSDDLLCLRWRIGLEEIVSQENYGEDYSSLVVDTAVLQGLHIPDSSGMLAQINLQAMLIARAQNNQMTEGEQ